MGERRLHYQLNLAHIENKRVHWIVMLSVQTAGPYTIPVYVLGNRIVFSSERIYFFAENQRASVS